MKKWILWLGGALLAVALAILGRDARTVRRLEQRAQDELATGSTEAMVRAERLKEQAAQHQAAASQAAAKTVERLEELSGKDQDMGDLLSHWQSVRVRQQSD